MFLCKLKEYISIYIIIYPWIAINLNQNGKIDTLLLNLCLFQFRIFSLRMNVNSCLYLSWLHKNCLCFHASDRWQFSILKWNSLPNRRDYGIERFGNHGGAGRTCSDRTGTCSSQSQPFPCYDSGEQGCRKETCKAKMVQNVIRISQNMCFSFSCLDHFLFFFLCNWNAWWYVHAANLWSRASMCQPAAAICILSTWWEAVMRF